MTSRPRFNLADIKRALLGARAAGVSPKELRIGIDGEIRLLLDQSPSPGTPDDIVDEIERHFRK